MLVNLPVAVFPQLPKPGRNIYSAPWTGKPCSAPGVASGNNIKKVTLQVQKPKLY